MCTYRGGMCCKKGGMFVYGVWTVRGSFIHKSPSGSVGRSVWSYRAHLPPVPDGVQDEEDEEAALEGGHEPQEGAGWRQKESGGAGDEDARLVHPVAGVFFGCV